jgi:thiol-disulfide isomerase/thioredoxin
LPVDRWTHLAVLMEGPAQKITVYEDGAVVGIVKGATSLTAILNQARDVFLGASFALDSCLSGGIDDVRLYGRALDAQEVARAMSGHPEGPYEPCPHHYAQLHAGVPAVVQWQGDDSTAAYNLYTGTSPDLMSLEASGLTNTRYTLARKPTDGQTLYWRVEAVRDDGTIPGPLWQFSVTNSSLNDVIAGASPWWVDYGKYNGRIVPDVALTDSEGRGHRLRDYRGRHLLVVLWASWCSVCRTEMVELANLAKAVGEDRLAILAIADESDKDAVPGFLASHPEITFPVCTTKISSLPVPLSLSYHFPSTFYIAPDGVIKLATIGPVPQAKMEAILGAAWPAQ